jgi:hypothetical protein
LIDILIWVQADEREAARRTAARAANRPAADLANRPVDGAAFDDDGWTAEEIPFNTAQRTWERADIIVCGTPRDPLRPEHRNRHRTAPGDIPSSRRAMIRNMRGMICTVSGTSDRV